MRKKLLALIAFQVFYVVHVSMAQEMIRCGTMEYMERLKAEDPGLEARLQQNEELVQKYISQTSNQRSDDAVITIPVVFHVLWNTSSQNVSQARILDQVATLNKDYGRRNTDTTNTPAVFKPLAVNTNIQFCLAQRDPNGNPTDGIVRKQVTVSGFDPMNNNNVKYSSAGGDNAWPRDKYLNVWVCNLNGSSNGLLGISQFPGAAAATDGCVVLYSTVGGSTYKGTIAYYNLGRTLTHEVGHWLNLRHVWGDATCGTDYVSDTPTQQTSNYSCPVFPHVTCSNGPNGDMFMNFMDYVNDNCMNSFSGGQATRMTTSINQLRTAILSSNGCLVTTGIDDLSGKLSLSVFPNPASGQFTILSQLNGMNDATVSVSNMLGEIVFTKELKNTPEINLNIDLSEYAVGVYDVSVKATEGIINKKIVLTR